MLMHSHSVRKTPNPVLRMSLHVRHVSQVFPLTDSQLFQPPTVDLQTSDSTTGEQCVEVDSEAHDLSFMHALSHDGTEMRELQQADPDINQILDWMGRSGSRPPKGWIRGSSRWL